VDETVTRINLEAAQVIANLHPRLATAAELADDFDQRDGFNAALDGLPGDVVPRGVNAERYLAGYRDGIAELDRLARAKRPMLDAFDWKS
jgi:hypothetical protein